MVVATDDLERHLRQFLDSTSHRLDAWLTSIAGRRFAVLRQERRTGSWSAGTAG